MKASCYTTIYVIYDDTLGWKLPVFHTGNKYASCVIYDDTEGWKLPV